MKNLLANRIQLIVWAILASIIFYLYIANGVLERKLTDKTDEADYYQAQVAQQTDIFKDEQGLWRNTTEVLQVSNRTLMQLKREKDPRVDELFKKFEGLRAANLQSFSTTTTHNETRFNVKIKDTIIYNDTSKVIKYKDKYLNLDVIIKHDTVASGKIEYIDNLDGIIYKKQKKFLFIPLEKPHYVAEMVSENPNTQITTNSIVMVKDKKKRNRH